VLLLFQALLDVALFGMKLISTITDLCDFVSCPILAGPAKFFFNGLLAHPLMEKKRKLYFSFLLFLLLFMTFLPFVLLSVLFLCLSFFQCLVAAISLFQGSVPSSAPSGDYLFTVNFKDLREEHLGCVKVPAKLYGSSSSSSPSSSCSSSSSASIPHVPPDPLRAHEIELITIVNSSPNVHWRAGHNSHFDGMSREAILGLMGVREGDPPSWLPFLLGSVHKQSFDPLSRNMALPARFDSRKKWGKMCPSVRQIQDQVRSLCIHSFIHSHFLSSLFLFFLFLLPFFFFLVSVDRFLLLLLCFVRCFCFLCSSFLLSSVGIGIECKGACGSCWAFGAAEAMSDRLCIESKGEEKAELSAADLVSCCSLCGFGCKVRE
jgi:hypothetical protein